MKTGGFHLNSAPNLSNLWGPPIISGCKKNLFSEQAVTAIHQGSGGLLRRANNLARGALVAAASEKCTTVSAEHVRIASTEII